ncbi:MAG: cysteine desulfurase [Treponemataceae bacterium]|nr:cysteine desulfurase [Treponemataceae bacterium]
MTQETAHYFDWAATAPADPAILQNALNRTIEAYGNPSSAHKAGQAAKRLLDEARAHCADALGVQASQLFFTSGGTEADHIPLLSVLTRPGKGNIIASAIEHPALREQCAQLAKLGYTVDFIAPDKDGFIRPETVAHKITGDTLFVTVMAVNNETGCVQDIAAIADAITQASAGKRRPHFHTDCVQAVGKIPLDITHKGIDSAAFSAHKICGPRGIGLLYLAKPIQPFLVGGGQEQRIRSGTENVFGALALADCLRRYGGTSNQTQAAWTRAFVRKLSEIDGCTIVPACRTESTGADRFSPFIVQAAFRGIPGNVMVRALDEKGFCISTGSACSAKKQSRPVLQAMGVGRDIQDTAVRFSFGPLTTEQGMDELLAAVQDVCARFAR